MLVSQKWTFNVLSPVFAMHPSVRLRRASTWQQETDANRFLFWLQVGPEMCKRHRAEEHRMCRALRNWDLKRLVKMMSWWQRVKRAMGWDAWG